MKHIIKGIHREHRKSTGSKVLNNFLTNKTNI